MSPAFTLEKGGGVISKIIKMICYLEREWKSSIGKGNIHVYVGHSDRSAIWRDQTFLIQPCHHPNKTKFLSLESLQPPICCQAPPIVLQIGFFPKKLGGLSAEGSGGDGEMEHREDTLQSSAGVSHPHSLALPGWPSFNSQTTQEY